MKIDGEGTDPAVRGGEESGGCGRRCGRSRFLAGGRAVHRRVEATQEVSGELSDSPLHAGTVSLITSALLSTINCYYFGIVVVAEFCAFSCFSVPCFEKLN